MHCKRLQGKTRWTIHIVLESSKLLCVDLLCIYWISEQFYWVNIITVHQRSGFYGAQSITLTTNWNFSSRLERCGLCLEAFVFLEMVKSIWIDSIWLWCFILLSTFYDCFSRLCNYATVGDLFSRLQRKAFYLNTISIRTRYRQSTNKSII